MYQSAATFKDYCQTVRTGVDLEGEPFPDKAGSTLLENFWLRSWTHETYLWNSEVTDQNPGAFSDRLAYFDVLRTTATTLSGKDKDQFHFSEPTEDYLARALSAPRASYGVSYAALAVTPPRDFRVAYNEPNSPAAQVVSGRINLPRGARILRVDGVDLVNANTQGAIDALNAGLFPATAGENHTFEIQDVGAPSSRTVNLTSASLSHKPVNRTSILGTPSGDVGYMLLTTFSPFSSEREIAEAMTAFKTQGVSDLVVDLRYNGGGLLATASELSYMIAGPARTNGKTFELLRFNADAGNIDPVTQEPNEPLPFLSSALGFSLAAGTPFDDLNLSRVYILTTNDTCSASESVINSLRGVDVEVVLVGAATCGKPYGFYPQDNCGETYYSIQFQGVNHKGFGDYADGFTPANSSAAFGVRAPGCVAPDDLDHELGDVNETLLATALSYRAGAPCPAFVTPQASVRARTSGLALSPTGASPIEEFVRANRDLARIRRR